MFEYIKVTIDCFVVVNKSNPWRHGLGCGRVGRVFPDVTVQRVNNCARKNRAIQL